MSWSDSLFGTVKFKVALSYAFLFVLSAAASFVVIYCFMNSHMLDASDAALREECREIIFEYLTGNRSRRFDREVPADQIPAAELEAFRRKIPDFRPVIAFERLVGNSNFRTIVGIAGENLYEVRMESSGTVFSRQLYPDRNLPMLSETFREKVLREGSSNLFFALFSPEDELRANSEFIYEISPSGAVRREMKFSTEAIGDRNFRVLRLKLFDGSTLVLGRSLRPLEARLEYYTHVFGAAAALVLLLGGVAGYLIARKFIAGVERVSEAAKHISGGDFSRRVQRGREGAEIDRLVDAFNTMNANTEALFQELKTVTDNIAHDLRTPLTRMRGMAELAAYGDEQEPEMAETVAEECNKMIALINTMLEITRTESALDAPARGEVMLNDLLCQAHELLLPLAEEKEIVFDLLLPQQQVTVCGDKVKIQRLVSNLLENAIKFTPGKGKVTLSLADGEMNAVLKVADTGLGIAAKDLPHVFDRFYRSDASRTLPGNGLGLALVRAIAQAHGGRVEVESESGKGSTFTVTLSKNMHECEKNGGTPG